MPDIALIGSVLSSLKAATEIAKLLRENDLSLQQAETKLKLADLITALADAKIEFADIQRLLLEKDEIISPLEKTLNIRKNLEWQSPYYWLNKKMGSKDLSVNNVMTIRES